MNHFFESVLVCMIVRNRPGFSPIPVCVLDVNVETSCLQCYSYAPYLYSVQ